MKSELVSAHRGGPALQNLHLDLGFAHMDVRLPNICFEKSNGKYIVKLIDFDRCEAIDGRNV